MTAPSGTFQAYQAVGNREDLTDMIYNLSPTETPFVAMAAKVKAKAVNHEWQTDALAAAAKNSNIEGDDSAVNTAVPTVRLSNRTQIFKKTIQVSGTQESVDKAGRDSEIAYQLMKRGKEIKRDIEFAATQNQGSSAGNASTPRQMAGLEAWITNYQSVGGGTAQTTPGFSSGDTAAPTDSTVTGSMTEEHLKTAISSAWSAGGNPTVVLVGPGAKKKISTFAGIATLYREAGTTAKGTRIVGAADIYVSDFGEHRIVPSRFSRDRTVLVLDMDFWALAQLRGMTKEKLAKTGDSEKWHLVTELTVEARNAASSAKIADVDSSK